MTNAPPFFPDGYKLPLPFPFWWFLRTFFSFLQATIEMPFFLVDYLSLFQLKGQAISLPSQLLFFSSPFKATWLSMFNFWRIATCFPKKLACLSPFLETPSLILVVPPLFSVPYEEIFFSLVFLSRDQALPSCQENF